MFNKIRAILFSGFSGEETLIAVADILFGVINPSGHLLSKIVELGQYYTKLNFQGNWIIIDEKVNIDIME